MPKLRYLPTSDLLFKMFLVKNPDILKELIAAALGVDGSRLGRIKIENPELLPEDDPGNKTCRLDVKVKLDGQTVDIEMQKADEGNYRDRSLYYWAKLHVSELNKGKDYADSLRTIQINILGFALFKEHDYRDYHTIFTVRENSHHWPLSDKLEMHFYELKKLPKTIDARDPMQCWLALFKAESTEELAAIGQMGDETMTKAAVKLRRLAEDEKYRRLEDMREEAAHEYASKLGGAYRRGEAAGEAVGRAAGEAVGRAERTLDIAKLMKADGFDIKVIAKYTGLKPDEVAGL